MKRNTKYSRVELKQLHIWYQIWRAVYEADQAGEDAYMVGICNQHTDSMFEVEGYTAINNIRHELGHMLSELNEYLFGYKGMPKYLHLNEMSSFLDFVDAFKSRSRRADYTPRNILKKECRLWHKGDERS